MRHTCLFALLMLATLMISANLVNAANPTQLQLAPLTRTIFIEPSYQVYVDDVTLNQSVNTYNITFNLPSSSVIFDVRAFGAQNQSLVVTQIPQTTNGTYNGNLTLSVDTQGQSSFRLLTLVQGMTYSPGNFTTLINFFPILDETTQVGLTIYLPSGSSLISYSLASLSNSSAGARTTIFGTMDVAAENSTYGTVSFSGNFSTVVADRLLNTVRILPNYVEFSETMTLINSGTSIISSVKLNVPSGSSGISAHDTIGALDTSVSGGTVEVSLRDYLYLTQKVEFTLVYDMPLSMIQTTGGRSMLDGNVLPDWFNMPCSSANVTIIMPTWSSDPQMAGAQIFDRYYGPVATEVYSTLTPYTNQAYAASYIPPSLNTVTVFAIIAALIIIMLVAIVVLKWRFFPSKKGALPDAKQAAKGK